MKNFKQWISDYRIIVLLFVVASLVASVQSYLLPHKKMDDSGPEYTRYNNYVIFKQSFYHLIDQKDLYTLYPEEHWDR